MLTYEFYFIFSMKMSLSLFKFWGFDFFDPCEVGFSQKRLKANCIFFVGLLPHCQLLLARKHLKDKKCLTAFTADIYFFYHALLWFSAPAFVSSK